MKIELGGGTNPKGEGFVNYDIIQEAEVVCDFNKFPFPLEDDSVDEVYSSHCLEHLENPLKVFEEIIRICKIGAKVEIRVPHWNHALAMSPGHLHVISDVYMERVSTPGHNLYRSVNGKVLKRIHLHYEPELHFRIMKRLPILPSDFILKNFPNCCHETRNTFVVQKAE